MTLFIFNLTRTLNRRQKIGAVTVIAITVIFCLLRYFAYSNNYEVYPYIPTVVIKPRERSASNLKIPRVIHQTWKSLSVPEALRFWILRHANFRLYKILSNLFLNDSVANNTFRYFYKRKVVEKPMTDDLRYSNIPVKDFNIKLTKDYFSWLEKHPEWEYKFWTDEEMRLYVKINSPDLLKLYDSYPHQAYRNDAFRYILLYHDGGLYADLDMEAINNVDEVFLEKDCILSQEPEEHAHFLSDLHSPPLVSNALMGCRKKHPFFKSLLQKLSSAAGLLYWNDVLHATGPYVVTEVYRSYTAGSWFKEAPSDLFLADAVSFHPRMDESMVDKIRQVCIQSQGHEFPSRNFEERQARLCDKILKPRSRRNFSDKPKVYTDHHWTHTWAGRRNDPFGILDAKQKFDISKILILPKPKERIF
ncbi:DgyrCDS6142 [Dimorphilus gyrociliatus]|uniref:DgyrCDS6142 n=1 Tax=Dimorphilus gyrociliatus TaxID=2664684 RepID=A0A7I8VM61_9ANNE|nr:DgyrCDS6142 [Dimorphilus gyrociliatus]